MTIEQAKKSLERLIFSNHTVYGIGTLANDDGHKYIRVVVANERTKAELLELFPDSKYLGHELEIIISEMTKTQ
jgi:hypothetical protein